MKNSETNNIQSHSRNTVLCDGFLIPMTDFVNNVGNIENYPSHENALSWIYNYATFLKQPLKLEMFVPCDEDGNIWQYPPTKEEWEWAQKDSADAEQSFKQKEYYYEKAKEKVLFEGFEYVKFINNGELLPYHRLTKNNEYFNVRFLDRNIEDLLTEFEYGIELTPAALYTIFG